MALKVLHTVPRGDTESRNRFLKEARCGAAIEHPNIMALHDFGHDGDLDFFVMGYVPGRTLDRMLPKKGLGIDLSLTYARQLASALAEIHSVGMMHRDLKPSNLYITHEKLVKVLDFGLATFFSEGRQATPRDFHSPKALERTILGPPGYMAPEHILGTNTDFRSDIFSFGVIFYEMLTGGPPFKERSHSETMRAILHQAVQTLPRCVPASLSVIILRCLQRQPARRYKVATHLQSALDRATRDLAPTRAQ